MSQGEHVEDNFRTLLVGLAAHDIGTRLAALPSDEERLVALAGIIAGVPATLRWRQSGFLLIAEVEAGEDRWRLGVESPGTAAHVVAVMIVSLIHEATGCTCSDPLIPCPASRALDRALQARAAA